MTSGLFGLRFRVTLTLLVIDMFGGKLKKNKIKVSLGKHSNTILGCRQNEEIFHISRGFLALGSSQSDHCFGEGKLLLNKL